jgi:hypothetical protein
MRAGSRRGIRRACASRGRPSIHLARRNPSTILYAVPARAAFRRCRCHASSLGEATLRRARTEKPASRSLRASRKTGGKVPAAQPRRRHRLRPLSRELADRSGSRAASRRLDRSTVQLPFRLAGSRADVRDNPDSTVSPHPRVRNRHLEAVSRTRTAASAASCQHGPAAALSSASWRG